jgi:hypothetical protein
MKLEMEPVGTGRKRKISGMESISNKNTLFIPGYKSEKLDQNKVSQKSTS